MSRRKQQKPLKQFTIKQKILINSNYPSLEKCDGCGEEFELKRIMPCYHCNKIYCSNCLDLHTEEVYLSSKERDRL